MSRILDALERELSGQADPAILEEFVFDLSSVAVSHFAHEETRFRDCAYADAEAHLADHRKIIRYLADLGKGMSGGSVSLDRAAVDYVRTWFNHHVVVFDGPYMQALAAMEGRHAAIDARSAARRNASAEGE